MKLTLDQIATIQSALALYAEKCEGRAEFSASDATFWKEELSTAQALHEVFSNTYDVQVADAPASSASPKAEPCGDIGCDAPCTPRPEPEPSKPVLIELIDNCPEEHEALLEVRNATLRQRRAAAEYLRVPLGGLTFAALRRVRERLHPHAAAA